MDQPLKDLSNIFAVSPNEKAVRSFLKEQIGSETNTDAMGNLTAFVSGKSHAKKIMIAASIDEAGFIVADITDGGCLKFKVIGGIDIRSVISKKVISEDGVRGVIGMKAVHLQKRSERGTVVSADSLFIDIGASSKEKALKQVRKGTLFSFDTQAYEVNGRICGKALSGITSFCLLEAMKKVKKPAYDTYYVFASQSETEMRGAVTAAFAIKPDAALIIGCVESSDMYGVEANEITARIGGGAVIDIMDRYSIQSKNITAELLELAENNNIKIQMKNSSYGSSMSGSVQLYGAETGCICIPCRYMNTPLSMMQRSDITAAAEITCRFAAEKR